MCAELSSKPSIVASSESQHVSPVAARQPPVMRFVSFISGIIVCVCVFVCCAVRTTVYVVDDHLHAARLSFIYPLRQCIILSRPATMICLVCNNPVIPVKMWRIISIILFTLYEYAVEFNDTCTSVTAIRRCIVIFCVLWFRKLQRMEDDHKQHDATTGIQMKSKTNDCSVPSLFVFLAIYFRYFRAQLFADVFYRFCALHAMFIRHSMDHPRALEL